MARSALDKQGEDSDPALAVSNQQLLADLDKISVLMEDIGRPQTTTELQPHTGLFKQDYSHALRSSTTNDKQVQGLPSSAIDDNDMEQMNKTSTVTSIDQRLTSLESMLGIHETMTKTSVSDTCYMWKDHSQKTSSDRAHIVAHTFAGQGRDTDADLFLSSTS